MAVGRTGLAVTLTLTLTALAFGTKSAAMTIRVRIAVPAGAAIMPAVAGVAITGSVAVASPTPELL